MKIALVANTSWYLVNFRHGLIQQLLADGHEVVAISPFDDYADRFSKLGVRWIDWNIDRRGLAIRAEFRALKALEQTYREIAPDVVHHFTIKPVLYGTRAARSADVPLIVNSVTGLGHLFTSSSVSKRAIRLMIRPWLERSLIGSNVRAVFQSAEDLIEVARKSGSVGKTAVLVAGSGVNVDRFRPRSGEKNGDSPLRVIFIGRLIGEKGIEEFVEAAASVRRSDESRYEFIAYGDVDLGNPTSVADDVLEQWKQAGDVSFPGHVEAAENLLAAADLVVLPSYREGTSRVLLEAAASGTPAIASNVPGCRGVVVDGETGILVPPRRPDKLAEAVQKLAGDFSMRQRLATKARQKAVAEFDEEIVIQRLQRCYRDLDDRSQVEAAWDANNHPGVFTISLDFELAWGTRNRPVAAKVKPWLDGTRDAITQLLALFETHEVSATWATVGALMLGGRSKRFLEEWFGDKRFQDIPDGDAKSHPHWFADDILEQLLDCRVPQELACHTLSHSFADPGPSGRMPLDHELRGFQRVWDDLGLKPCRTFIFPKAYMGHFGLLAEHGYRAIRGREPGWFERLPQRHAAATARLIDARWAVTPRVRRPTMIGNGLWELPSSQFYSPIMSVGRYVSTEARVRKAIRGLRSAASTGSIYHLWTHPFNLGQRTDELIEGFNAILKEASRLRDAGQLIVVPMVDAICPFAAPSVKSIEGDPGDVAEQIER